MRKFLLAFCIIVGIGIVPCHSQNTSSMELISSIQENSDLDTVQSKALALLKGFSAGTSYSEVWIRDFNTFIAGSLKVHNKDQVADMLLMFFKSQGADGDIIDGLVDSAKANGGYNYRYSKLLPGWAGHKNTVETDQESSLVQAVTKYVELTGDTSFLSKRVAESSVYSRMEASLNYILAERWSSKYGMVIGATTIDWGDVQPETGWGVNINEHTKWSIDIYDNAMFAIAIQDFLRIKPTGYQLSRDWSQVALNLRSNVRQYLWNSAEKKYRPHIYLDGSPFSASFNESAILYFGGSICAILAGFNTRAEVCEINRQLVAASKKEKFATIGMTVYPPYPSDAYPNMHPFTYQNGGDWTWFGGRIISALLSYGCPVDAYKELEPMIQRVINHHGFYEWYDVQTGEPKGSGNFRGEAGVLYEAVQSMKEWAAKQNKKSGRRKNSKFNKLL